MRRPATRLVRARAASGTYSTRPAIQSATADHTTRRQGEDWRRVEPFSGRAGGRKVRLVRSPKDFFKPLAVGAPAPLREIPVRPSRMIHFFPASNPKIRAKLPEMVGTVDVLLANLEDGVPASDKAEARAGLVDTARSVQFGKTQFWTRVNSLDSPWGLDDLTAAVLEAGTALDVIMIPKVEGAEDIHYVDRLLAQLEAKAGLPQPLLVHAILETARGVANVEEICL